MIKKITRGLTALAMLALSITASAEKLPSFVTLITADGTELPANKLSNNGKPMLVSLWATWCGPCVNELSAIAPELAKWEKEYGVKVIAVNVEGTEAKPKAEAMMKARGWDGIELMFEKDRALSRAFKVTGIPFMIYIDGNGEILDTTAGFNPDLGASHIINHLKELLEQQKQADE